MPEQNRKAKTVSSFPVAIDHAMEAIAIHPELKGKMSAVNSTEFHTRVNFLFGEKPSRVVIDRAYRTIRSVMKDHGFKIHLPSRKTTGPLVRVQSQKDRVYVELIRSHIH